MSCGRDRSGPPPRARNLLLVTIDTLRADHVGAYGYARSQASFLDALASNGTVFDRAFAAAPITLPSHATILTGRYPPGHGARDNGMRVSATVPTLATELKSRGFRTAAFVAAFPLDHQFGLDRGFDVYSDRLGHDASGHPANERPAARVVDEAIAWLNGNPQWFLWVHVFEPHAPYGDAPQGSLIDRYDQEIGVANRELQRLMTALGDRAADTVVIAAGDHGEAFGEHGEWAHSIFVYDTTLRVPLIIRTPNPEPRTRTKNPEPRTTNVATPVTLADVAPTAMGLLGFAMKDVDGVDLSPALAGGAVPARELYAESFAPLVEFGWAPLRAIRSGTWKYIAAPKPELFDVAHDAAETVNLIAAQPDAARDLEQRASRYSGAALPTLATAIVDPQAAERLRALGYAAQSQSQSQSQSPIPNPQSPMDRPDPKDRRELAAKIAQVTSGELTGAELVSALETIVRADPRNGQAHLRLAYAHLQANDCAHAEPEFHAAAATGLPSADIYLGLATCLGRRNDLAGAERALTEARRVEPDNPVVVANLGILQASKGNLAAAVDAFNAALARDPDLHEARFDLAVTYLKLGRRADAAAAARELLARLPQAAPQRSEVERLLRAAQ